MCSDRTRIEKVSCGLVMITSCTGDSCCAFMDTCTHARTHTEERNGCNRVEEKRFTISHSITLKKNTKGRGRPGYYLCLTPHTSFYLCANRPLCMTALCVALKAPWTWTSQNRWQFCKWRKKFWNLGVNSVIQCVCVKVTNLLLPSLDFWRAHSCEVENFLRV